MPGFHMQAPVEGLFPTLQGLFEAVSATIPLRVGNFSIPKQARGVVLHRFVT
jgi:hypothetical protein